MWVKVISGTAIVALTLTLVVYASRMPHVQISEILVEGSRLSNSALIKELAQNELDGYYGFLIPKRNALLYPRTSIAESIELAYPEIRDLAIHRNGYTSLTVTITERIARALWCEQGSSDCYFMDEEGYVYARSPSHAEYIRFSGMLAENRVGATYLDGSFAPLFDLVRNIEDVTNRTALTVHVDETNDVFLAFKDGGVLRFVRTNEKREALDNIASVFASGKLNEGAPFEYADFRFGDKVYVKY